MHEQVQDYYGKVLQHSDDLQTNACCTDTQMPHYVKAILGQIHDEVLTRYYGCGLVLPECLEGMRILDLGCGSGRDCYVLSKLVGETGYVVGVDMTTEQLEVARKHIDYHTAQFGFSQPNIEFKQGYIERLDELDLAPASFDIIVSNCVVNLSPDKEAVLQQAFNLLKPGGEMYFSDVYSSRRIPAALVQDPVLYGECLSGALYWNDFVNLAKRVGFKDPRLVSDRPISIQNADIEATLKPIEFFSATYRLFKIAELEPACEDYGQAVIFNGGMPHVGRVFSLDAHHMIEQGKIFPVCGNTYRMLQQTRFQPYFQFIGDWHTHYGIFAGCGTDIPFQGASTEGVSASCC